MLCKTELQSRLSRFLETAGDAWDTAFIVGKINQYYFTGTMQDGLLLIKRSGGLHFFVRRSFERARTESPLSSIHPMGSYRDAAQIAGADCGAVLVETELMPLAMLERLRKYFTIDGVLSGDRALMQTRSVKSPYELSIMERCGARHHDFLTNTLPGLVREGMSETDFTGKVYEAMLRHGHQGLVRFGMFQNETVCGQMGFGENALYPTNFDGPGGMKGMGSAIPVIGDRRRLLKKGDLIFVDFAYGIEGYHTDKTQIYSFGAPPSPEVSAMHKKCITLSKQIAARLCPGEIPAEIYRDVTENLAPALSENFMGFGTRQARFLGHGIGLQVDEAPVIAAGFNAPLENNMIFAVEPKKGVPGAGIVGVEDTYVVTSEGGRCITGGPSDIIVI